MSLLKELPNPREIQQTLGEIEELVESLQVREGLEARLSILLSKVEIVQSSDPAAFVLDSLESINLVSAQVQAKASSLQSLARLNLKEIAERTSSEQVRIKGLSDLVEAEASKIRNIYETKIEEAIQKVVKAEEVVFNELLPAMDQTTAAIREATINIPKAIDVLNRKTLRMENTVRSLTSYLKDTKSRIEILVTEMDQEFQEFTSEIVEGIVPDALETVESTVEELESGLEESLQEEFIDRIDEYADHVEEMLETQLDEILSDVEELVNEIFDELEQVLLGGSDEGAESTKDVAESLSIAEPAKDAMMSAVDSVKSVANSVGVPI